jgi:hypothetical protein
MDDRKRLLDLIVEAKKHDPETAPWSEWLVDYLIAHGVVVREDGCEVCRRHVPPGANYCWKCGRPLR